VINVGYGFGPPPGYGSKKGKPKKTKPAQGAPKSDKGDKRHVRLLDALGTEMPNTENPKAQLIFRPGFHPDDPSENNTKLLLV